MNLKTRSSLGLLSVLFLAAAACNVRLGSDSPAAAPSEASPGAGTIADRGAADPNGEVVEVTVVGTSATSTFQTDGAMGITMLPLNAAHEVVLAGNLAVDVTFASPSGLSALVAKTECTALAPDIHASAIGIVIDDSGSMEDNDPALQRRSAAVSFIKSLGADDTAVLTDYGNQLGSLRDLTCFDNATRQFCADSTPTFTGDKAKLIGATANIAAGQAGTPLYESCEEMVGIVDAVRDRRRGMLLLSDGQPDSMSKRNACHDAAKRAGIPVFTVGLGPAAEADPKADPAAVKVLRELASETGGSYASANDPGQLDRLFSTIGTALARGNCKTTLEVKSAAPIPAGTTITGEISVGRRGAKASFTFVTAS